MDTTPAKTLPTYQVESILDHKRSGQHTRYLVHWKGYNNHDNTCKPEGIINADELLEAYWKGNRLTYTLCILPSITNRLAKYPRHWSYTVHSEWLTTPVSNICSQ